MAHVICEKLTTGSATGALNPFLVQPRTNTPRIRALYRASLPRRFLRRGRMLRAREFLLVALSDSGFGFE